MLRENIANGQSNDEYVTIIFELCGIKETWTQPEIGKWVSDQVELRNNLRELVQLIKNRVVQNVHDHQKMESATEFIKMWIEFKKNEVG